MSDPSAPHDGTALPANHYNPHAWIVGEPRIGAFTVIDGSGGLEIGRGCDVSRGAQIYTRHLTIGAHSVVGAGAVAAARVRSVPAPT